jgi:hypothetical protein
VVGLDQALSSKRETIVEPGPLRAQHSPFSALNVRPVHEGIPWHNALHNEGDLVNRCPASPVPQKDLPCVNPCADIVSGLGVRGGTVVLSGCVVKVSDWVVQLTVGGAAVVVRYKGDGVVKAFVVNGRVVDVDVDVTGRVVDVDDVDVTGKVVDVDVVVNGKVVEEVVTVSVKPFNLALKDAMVVEIETPYMYAPMIPPIIINTSKMRKMFRFR